MEAVTISAPKLPILRITDVRLELGHSAVQDVKPGEVLGRDGTNGAYFDMAMSKSVCFNAAILVVFGIVNN
jgi:hypothetical protein